MVIYREVESLFPLVTAEPVMGNKSGHTGFPTQKLFKGSSETKSVQFFSQIQNSKFRSTDQIIFISYPINTVTFHIQLILNIYTVLRILINMYRTEIDKRKHF